jgi:poly-gamma-glutamate biosynthesis protein PgsC/CapC
MLELFFIGLIVGFVYYELTDVSPGGVVAPAYCALYIEDPLRIVTTILLALVVWAVLVLLSKRLIIYGRRRLLLAILLGFGLKAAVALWLQPAVPFGFDLQSIGYIVPGLIANEMARQKVLPTTVSLGTVSIVVWLIMLLVR